jgi:hypothetical protein
VSQLRRAYRTQDARTFPRRSELSGDAYRARTREVRPYHRLISHRFGLADINEAFDQSEWQKPAQTPVVRAVLVP